MAFARIVNGMAADVVTAPPADLFHPDFAAQFVAVPDTVSHGWVYDSGTDTWSAPPEPDPVPEPPPPPKLVNTVLFKSLFTVTERLAIKTIRNSTDPADQTAKAVLDDWFELLDDPRLPEVDLNSASIQEGLDYLVTLTILTEARKATILEGPA